MIIHVVKTGETTYSIAEFYKITVAKLMQDNELLTLDNLVIGQTIVIVSPEQTYIVQEGDSVRSIADAHGISQRQLLRNNPYISAREFMYEGETIDISNNKNKKKISTNGYAYPYIRKELLRKTLPFLTYLTIINYRVIEEGEIICYGIDDAEIIKMAKEYSVAPLVLITTLTGQGEPNIEAAYNILLNQEYQDHYIENMLNILKTKGYYGVNISIQYLRSINQNFYQKFIDKISSRLGNAGYQVFMTINPRITYNENGVVFDKVDYSGIGQAADNITFLSYNWAQSYGPPVPYCVSLLKEFLDYSIAQIPSDKINIGIPIVGYNWQLPYEINKTKATSLSFDTSIDLAREVGATIQYNNTFQEAFFEYSDENFGVPIQHIVWFKDARSIEALVNLVEDYELQGGGIWNIMQYFTQMWLVINSKYEIETVLS